MEWRHKRIGNGDSLARITYIRLEEFSLTASNELVYKGPEEPGYSITTMIQRCWLLGVVDSYNLTTCLSEFSPLDEF